MDEGIVAPEDLFEAPAAEILIAAHRELEKLTLLATQTQVKELVSGIYGQLIHVEPKRRLVVAKLSSWPDPINDTLDDLTYRAIDAIGRELAD